MTGSNCRATSGPNPTFAIPPLRYVKAGDVADFLTLRHDQFLGWPQEIADKKIDLTYSLTKEGGRDFGNIVAIYFRAKSTAKYPDGHVDPEEDDKITHTWIKTGSTWQIIGGMAAPAPASR